MGLARALGVLALDGLTELLAANREVPSNEEILAGLLGRMFERSYERHVFVHVYNLDLEGDSFDLDPPRLRIVALGEHDIPVLTGEPTPVSTLFNPDTGSFFLAFSDQGSEEGEHGWLDLKWREAYDVVRVLKYVKGDVIDIDWASIFYRPDWVNKVWKFGVYMLGRPRWDVQPAPYELKDSDRDHVLRYMRFYVEHRALFEDFNSPLRKSTALAGDYYEAHHGRQKPEDQLVDLAIAVEALFSPTPGQGELRFRIAQRAGLLLGSDAAGRKEIARFIRRMYNARSDLVHGNTNPFLAGKVTPVELQLLADLVRQGILRLVTINARGHTQRERVLDRLDEAAMDVNELEGIRLLGDFEQFIDEHRQRCTGCLPADH